MKNLALKQNALDDFNLPVKIVAGHIGILYFDFDRVQTLTLNLFVNRATRAKNSLGKHFCS